MKYLNRTELLQLQVGDKIIIHKHRYKVGFSEQMSQEFTILRVYEAPWCGYTLGNGIGGEVPLELYNLTEDGIKEFYYSGYTYSFRYSLAI